MDYHSRFSNFRPTLFPRATKTKAHHSWTGSFLLFTVISKVHLGSYYVREVSYVGDRKSAQVAAIADGADAFVSSGQLLLSALTEKLVVGGTNAQATIDRWGCRRGVAEKSQLSTEGVGGICVKRSTGYTRNGNRAPPASWSRMNLILL